MKKLTIEHLAAYLPYNIRYIECWQASFTNQPDIVNNKIMNLQNIGVLLVQKRYKFKHAKPILRPLSDLTKEIEVNGKKFVPLAKLSEWLYDQEPDNFDNIQSTRSWIVAIMRGNDHLNLPYKIVQKLLEWHFDIFELIKNNLAIDINTL